MIKNILLMYRTYLAYLVLWIYISFNFTLNFLKFATIKAMETISPTEVVLP